MNKEMKKTHETQQLSLEFARQILFLKDAETVIALFPFHHQLSDSDYQETLNNIEDVESYPEETLPTKHDYCLMFTTDLGWTWVDKRLIYNMDEAEEEEYLEMMNLLLNSNVIKKQFILNER